MVNPAFQLEFAPVESGKVGVVMKDSRVETAGKWRVEIGSL